MTTLRNKPRETEALPLELLHAHVHRKTQSVLNGVLSAYSLAPIDWFILVALVQKPDGMLIGELAELMHVKSTFMTKSIQQLVDKGLVFSMTRARDRRVRRIAPRQHARILVQELSPKIETALAPLYAPLTHKEKGEYRRLLEKVQIGDNDR